MAACFAVLPGAARQVPLDPILNRVSEEAEAFRRLAPAIFAEETLEQHARLPGPRFHPRIGASALEAPPPHFQNRRIVSEFGFGVLKESPGVLHEFRKVISVDDRKVNAPEKARRSLTLGMRTADDSVKKRLLLDFEKAGLAGTVTDFGQVILLFSRRRLGDYEFSAPRAAMLDGAPVLVLAYRQRAGSQSLTIFEGRQAIHQALAGELWVRRDNGVPLRITVKTRRDAGGTLRREETSVDYAMTAHGALAPATVVYRQYAGEQMMVENVFRYAEFRRFSAESEIKFTAPPEEAPKR